MSWSQHVVMITSIDLSQEMLAVDVLTALKSFWSIVKNISDCDCYDYMEIRLRQGWFTGSHPGGGEHLNVK